PNDAALRHTAAAAAEQARTEGVRVALVPTRAAEALNALFAQYAAPPRLTRHDGHPWHLHVDRGESSGWGGWFLAAGALELSRLLTEYGRITWGACAAGGCGRFFLGTGPGSARRYCSPACATRARVAAHRRRKRAQGTERA
ncbi:CGNR zinc finger domain-containing protein, partial [Streptomyces sp. NPDC059456]|uniref:CGNR zinc finger domain-containing protein n=1 Tax=Streptomyces sp. NPDC059456 TaxID=3346838 RepID=UPI003678D39F